MRITSFIALILVIVGALNWLLIGVASFDLVAAIFGVNTLFTRIVYSLVGVASLWTIYYLIAFNPLRGID